VSSESAEIRAFAGRARDRARAFARTESRESRKQISHPRIESGVNENPRVGGAIDPAISLRGCPENNAIEICILRILARIGVHCARSETAPDRHTRRISRT
jgi:hypothetical protein